MCDGTIFNFTHSIYTLLRSLLAAFSKWPTDFVIRLGLDTIKWNEDGGEWRACIVRYGTLASSPSPSPTSMKIYEKRWMLCWKKFRDGGWLKRGRRSWRIIISLTILIFYVWIFIFTYSAMWRFFKSFSCIQFRVDMLDIFSSLWQSHLF